jgi:hypothetical protein
MIMRALRIVAGIAFAAMAAAAGGSIAASPGGGLDALVAANTLLKAKIVAADQADKAPPTLADDAGEVRSAFSLEALSAAPETIGSLLSACDAGGGSEMAYMLYGLGRSGVRQADKAAAAQIVARLEGRNELRFQDEFALATRFSVACAALEVPQAEAFIASLPPADLTDTRRAGLQQLRKGLLEVFAGAILVQSDPLRRANKDLILYETVTAAPVLMTAVPLADRQKLRDLIDRVLPSTADASAARTSLQQLKAVLASTDCRGLCAF